MMDRYQQKIIPVCVRRRLCFFWILLHALSGRGDTKIWSGASGDGRWASAANWSGNTVPGPGDDVLLDQSVVPGNYSVTLPDFAVTVKTVHIAPEPGFEIRMIIPVSNRVSPAFTALGPGYGILLEAGGILENGCGIMSGESLMIADSIRINNGGEYIHRTQGSHATSIVSRLSTMPGTEQGIFEFDVPKSSYTLSVSNRTYGTLSLRAAALGGPVNYTGNGSNPLTIRGDLRIAAGVTFGVDLSGANGNIDVRGDFVQEGGVFNLSSGAGNTTVVRIAGNLIQSSGSVITETNTGLPVLELNGSSPQILSLAGAISNQVSLRMNNRSGSSLLYPLSLPYKLELVAGRITTTEVNLLDLMPGCSLVADSSRSANAYVDGPLRKEGLSAVPYFLFPVGKNGMLRWLELKNASGNFTVEYYPGDPHGLSSSYQGGLDHISSVEYWMVRSDGSSGNPAEIELSYGQPESGGVTDPAYLDIAYLSAGLWNDAGHLAGTGDFTEGSVVSQPLDTVRGTAYTLASTVGIENPLPVVLIDFSGQQEDLGVKLSWKIDLPREAAYFELYGRSQDLPERIDSIGASDGMDHYSFTDPAVSPDRKFYRLKVVDKNGVAYFSRIIEVAMKKDRSPNCKLFPNPVEGAFVILQIHPGVAANFQWQLTSVNGQKLGSGEVMAVDATENIPVPVACLSRGIYQLSVSENGERKCVLRFIKK
jgi:hypothetical protein